MSEHEQWRPWTPERFHLAEGARFHRGGLHFVDLLSGTLYSAAGRPGDRSRRVLDLGIPLGAAAPVEGAAGEWIVAAGTGIALVGPSGRLRWLARPEERPGAAMRMNDAVCDSRGRFWAGSMETTGATAAGSLYRVDPDGAVERVLEGLTVPNGPAFAPCGTTMYLADSALGSITAYPVEPRSGALGVPRAFASLGPDEGRPDGMTVDDAGHLWVALWGAGQIRRYRPDGCPDLALDVPTPRPTSVVFGGGRMFVTTARRGPAEPDGLAGAVLVRTSTVAAPPAACFGRRP